MKVYEAIAEVAAELAARGISKDSRNQAQGFNFRGIDAVYNALAPLLAKHKLCILPRCIKRECVERTNAKGNALFYVTVQAEFDMVSAEDGSKHTVATFGEAMDSGDKATNKAMSAAYKYAAFQAFCIPTEETSTDADGETHEVRGVPDSLGLANAVQAIRNAATVDEIGKHLKAAASMYPKSVEALQKHATERKEQILQQQQKETV
jgi:hypothetical protein